MALISAPTLLVHALPGPGGMHGERFGGYSPALVLPSGGTPAAVTDVAALQCGTVLSKSPGTVDCRQLAAYGSQDHPAASRTVCSVLAKVDGGCTGRRIGFILLALQARSDAAPALLAAVPPTGVPAGSPYKASLQAAPAKRPCRLPLRAGFS